GLGTGTRCVQLAPSHSQVSPNTGPNAPRRPLPPPKSTTRSRSESYASACALRAGGLFTGASCVQTEPSHCQVSTSTVTTQSKPPNNSVRLRCESNAIAWRARWLGAVAGVCWNHCVPSHSHVSANTSPVVASEPPNTTVRARIGSYTDAASSRSGRPDTRCFQLLPFHSHMSPRGPSCT